jgi:7-cyano-7-deazaguanine synthase in queuosine biosynthesis
MATYNVLFSGGVDSTQIVYDLSRNCDEINSTINLIWIDMKNNEIYNEYKKVSINALIEKLKSMYPHIRYNLMNNSNITIHPVSNDRIDDLTSVYEVILPFFISLMLRDEDVIYYGINRSDTDKNLDIFKKVLNTMNEITGKNIKLETPLLKKMWSQNWNDLSYKLKNITNTCETPSIYFENDEYKIWVECGCCNKCLQKSLSHTLDTFTIIDLKNNTKDITDLKNNTKDIISGEKLKVEEHQNLILSFFNEDGCNKFKYFKELQLSLAINKLTRHKSNLLYKIFTDSKSFIETYNVINKFNDSHIRYIEGLLLKNKISEFNLDILKGMLNKYDATEIISCLTQLSDYLTERQTKDETENNTTNSCESESCDVGEELPIEQE